MPVEVVQLRGRISVGDEEIKQAGFEVVAVEGLASEGAEVVWNESIPFFATQECVELEEFSERLVVEKERICVV